MSELPDRPDLDQLRRQARELLRAAAAGEPRAITRLRAVSERVTLSAAQLAIAREHGYPSWPALGAEVQRRRRMSESAGRPVQGGDARGPLDAPEDRWSFGGGTAIETAAGVLFPEALVADADHAVLDASLMPSGNGEPAAARPRRLPVPAMPLARFVPGRARAIRRARRRRADAAVTAMRSLARPDDLTVIDDRGARYALHPEGMHGPSGEPAGPWSLRLRLDPVPGREVRWLELRSQNGAATRLTRSGRPAVRISQLTAVAESPAERELPDQALPADGPRRHLDICAALPPIDGVTVQADTLISMSEGWRLYLRARPGWWNYSEDGHRKWSPVSVHAEDDRAGTYQSIFDGSTGHRGHEELALRFLPRLDPLARSLKLTCRGASEEVVVDLGLRLDFDGPSEP